jgi:hypothetical protein
MELEEAIEILNNMRTWDCREPDSKCVEAIEIVLSELDSLKFKCQARKDRTDTIITKQEKMIELMVEFIDTELSSEHLSRVLEKEVLPLETYRKDIKQYFEKKAEEIE